MTKKHSPKNDGIYIENHTLKFKVTQKDLEKNLVIKVGNQINVKINKDEPKN